MRPRQRPDQRLVGPWFCRRPRIAAVGRDDHLAAAAALPGYRDADGDRRAVEFPILSRDLALALSCRSGLSRLQLLDQRLQPIGPQPHFHAIGREVDPLDQSRTIRACSAGNSSSHRGAKCGDASRRPRAPACSSSLRAAAQVRAMISGVRSRCRTCVTTASSTSAAGTLRTEHSE